MSGPTLRPATLEDVAELSSLINLAYRVEDFFKIGDRTDEADVLAAMESGPFLVLAHAAGHLVGSIHVEVRGDRGYFGMLSVHPDVQGTGLGRRLIDEAENYCVRGGCGRIDLELVNLRKELPAFYRKFGYRVIGTSPFPAVERTKLPCHFIVMSKPLVAESGTAKEVAR